MHPWAIFVESLKNWRINWRKLAGIYLLIYIPLTVLDIVNALWMVKGTRPGLIQFGGSLVHWVFDALAVASLILSVKEQSSAVIIGVVETIKVGIKNLWWYILTTLLYSIIIGAIVLLVIIIMSIVTVIFTKTTGIALVLLLAAIAIIACVAGMVYCAVRFSLAGIICIVENVGPVASLKISHNLIKARVSPVIGTYLIIFLLIVLCFIPVYALGPIIAPKSLALILLTSYQVLVGAVLVPVWITAQVMLYKKLKEVVS